jgi:hypothetical protein
MPGFFLHTGASVSCTHKAPAMIPPAQPRVTVSGMPVATLNAKITVAGCPFQVPVGVGTKPQPCVTIQWANVSTRVTVMGQPVLLQANPGPGVGVCQSAEQIPQGPPFVDSLQTRVSGM